MKLSRLDLNLFVVFEAIYAQGNLTRAAEVLNLTQPAVSNALARLRDSLDDPLFVRHGRGMTATPVAEGMIGSVRQALRQLQTSVDARGRFDPATADKTFHIAIRDAASSVLVPDLMLALRREAPGVRLHCHQLDRRDIPPELASGKLDLAIDIPQLGGAQLDNAELLSDRFVCTLRRGHPLADEELTLERYLQLDHVTVSSRRRGRGYVEYALLRLKRQTETVLRLQHYQPAFHVVMASDMAFSVPVSLANRYDVVQKALPFPVPPLESWLHWHRSVGQDPANRWLRERLIEASRLHRDDGC